MHKELAYQDDGRLDFANELEQQYAKVLRSHTDPRGSDVFGAVAGGYLAILGPVMEVMFENGHMVKPTGEHNAYVSIIPYFDFEQDTDVSVVHYYLFIGATTEASYPTHGLIPRRLNRTVAQYCGLTTSSNLLRRPSRTSTSIHRKPDLVVKSPGSPRTRHAQPSDWKSWFERIGVFKCSNESYETLSWLIAEKTVTIV